MAFTTIIVEFSFRHRQEAGFAQHALYLLRPDTYIALADGSGAVDVLQRYFDRHKIRIEHAVGKVEYASE
jgi:hypothetical protein